MRLLKIRVLIVDDSALMRKHLRALLEATGEFDVTVARDGRDALEKLHAVDPDVITLDVNMPEMDGLTCLARIMSERPKPVVMVSSLTSRGAEATFEALALGAVDYVPKPAGTISLSLRHSADAIVAKIRTAATVRTPRVRAARDRVRPPSRQVPGVPPQPTMLPLGLVLIGVSTGGPSVLEDVLPHLPANFPWAILIAQHMPESFSGTFAPRLDSLCRIGVEEVSRRAPLRAGRCYVGRSGTDLVVMKQHTDLVAASVPREAARLWHPSVARLVESAMASVLPTRLIGVMLTGMGNDGAEAMTELHRRGGRTIAEAESTAVVFGMPGELIRLGGADTVVPSHLIAKQLISWLAAPAVHRSSH